MRGSLKSQTPRLLSQNVPDNARKATWSLDWGPTPLLNPEAKSSRSITMWDAESHPSPEIPESARISPPGGALIKGSQRGNLGSLAAWLPSEHRRSTGFMARACIAWIFLIIYSQSSTFRPPVTQNAVLTTILLRTRNVTLR